MNIFIRVSKDVVKSIDLDAVLTYRVEGEAYKQGVPSLGEYVDYESRDGYYLVEFELLNDGLKELLPTEGQYEFGVDKGVMKQCVAVVDATTAQSILDLMNASEVVPTNKFKVYTLDTAELKTEGAKPMKEKTLKHRGIEFPVQGGELDEQVKAYMAQKGCNYEVALLEVSKIKKES